MACSPGRGAPAPRHPARNGAHQSLGRERSAALPTETKSGRLRSKRHHDDVIKKEFDRHQALRIIALVAILAFASLIVAGLFAPGLKYSLATPPKFPVDAPQFLDELEPLVNSKLTHNNSVEVLENGENFYAAELDAMRHAQRSINIEAYIFHKGKITKEVIGLLTERAKAGVHVNLVIDSLGSLSTLKASFKQLKQAGGKVEWYHRLRLHNWFRSNNRTHREITVVDGSVAFVGGAGYADWWRYDSQGMPRWRDAMVRVRGDAVRGIQSSFLENWLEASGQILDGPDYFPPLPNDAGDATALVVTSTPSSGGSTRARVLYQIMFAAARKSILINTPYFLPDRSMRRALADAKKRGVDVKIVVPGKHADHTLTRSSGRSAYGDLLKAGVELYEYEPTMIHAKIAIIDGVWSIVGSTNLDYRSFGINDEVSLAVLNPGVAARLIEAFDNDLTHSRQVTLKEWNDRGLMERGLENIGWIFEHQQ
jgi:cardiolipin synthase A/B